MKETNTEQMDAAQVFCPNEGCEARGQVGQGNIVSQGKARARYRCKTCGKTFSARAGTIFEGLRKPKALIVIVVTLVAYGCPIQALVHAFGLDSLHGGKLARSSGEALPGSPSGCGATGAPGSGARASLMRSG
jgi:transposase-like protein